MKAFKIFLGLTVIGLCGAVPRFDLPPKEITPSSEVSEAAERTTVIPSEDIEVHKHETTAVESRKKKEDGGGMEKMHMMLSMCKSVLSMIMMLIQPVFQVKALGISLVGMFINIARFVMQLKEKKSGGGGGGGGVIGGSIGGGPWMMGGGSVWGGEDRVGVSIPATFHPNYITSYRIKQ